MDVINRQIYLTNSSGVGQNQITSELLFDFPLNAKFFVKRLIFEISILTVSKTMGLLGLNRGSLRLKPNLSTNISTLVCNSQSDANYTLSETKENYFVPIITERAEQMSGYFRNFIIDSSGFELYLAINGDSIPSSVPLQISFTMELERIQ